MHSKEYLLGQFIIAYAFQVLRLFHLPFFLCVYVLIYSPKFICGFFPCLLFVIEWARLIASFSVILTILKWHLYLLCNEVSTKVPNISEFSVIVDSNSGTEWCMLDNSYGQLQ